MKSVSTFLRSQGLKQSIFLTITNIGSTGISAVAIIFLSRFLKPNDFGLFSVGLSLIAISSQFSELGLNTSIQKSLGNAFGKKNEMIPALWQQSIILKLIFTFIVLVIMLLFSPIISNWLKISNVLFTVFCIILSVSTISYGHLQTTLQSAMHYLDISIMSFCQATIKFFGVLIIGFFGIVSPISAIGVFFVSLLVSSVYGHQRIPKKWWSKTTLGTSARQTLLNLSKYTAIAMIASTITENIDTLFVQSFMTSFDTGIFSATSKIAIFFAIAGSTMSSVQNIRASRYDEKIHLFSFLKKSVFATIVLSGMVIVLIPFSKIILQIISPQYVSGEHALQIFLISTVITILTGSFYAVFFAIHRPKFFALSGIFQAVSLILFDFLLIPNFGVEGAATARVLSRILLLIFTASYALVTIKAVHGELPKMGILAKETC